MINQKPFMLHIEGMDLAGKSTIANLFAETSKLEWKINDKRLKLVNPIYDFAWECSKTNKYNSEVIGHMYLAALMEELSNFSYDVNIVQDSTLLLRSLNFYTVVNKNEGLIQEYSNLISLHPIPTASFFLTASISARCERLKIRMRHMPEKITSMDKMILEDPKRFEQINLSLMELSIKVFNSIVVDTSNMTEDEVVKYIRSCCPINMRE